MSRIVILCGGRNHPPFTEAQRAWLYQQHVADPFLELIVGSEQGADREGRKWGDQCGIDCVTFWPNWVAFRKPAGPRRNTRMLVYATGQVRVHRGSRLLVIAFPGDKGTLDMCTQARQRQVEVRTWDAYAGGTEKEAPVWARHEDASQP